MKKPFSYCYNPPLTWFRVFGIGLAFRNKRSKLFRTRFSERIGKKKYLDIFGYRITYLKINGI